MKHLYSVILLTLLPLLCSARTFRLEGMIGGEYPIVIELEEFMDGLISGKYAYKSTLRKSGDVPCSWLSINPNYDDPVSTWEVRDCDLKHVETWADVRFADRKTLTARMKNVKGRTYAVVATVTETNESDQTWERHFKSHVGDYPVDFNMFSDPSLLIRLMALMGEDGFNYLAYILQTQNPIEYHSGMFWSFGFMAHQCCDPAAIWAYDTASETFNVWIRKDGQDYWWSEAGPIPLKFHQLVDSQF